MHTLMHTGKKESGKAELLRDALPGILIEINEIM